MSNEAAQHIVNCEACNYPIEYWFYCNVCHCQLCQRDECLHQHQGEVHDVVPFERRSKKKHKQILYELCPTHPEKILNNFCRSCNQKACDRCILLKHRDMKEHIVLGMNDIAAEKAKEMEENTNILKFNVIPRYVKEIQDLAAEISDLREAYDVKRKIIQQVHQLWQDEIKTIIDQILADLKDLENVHWKRLKDQKDSLQTTLNQMADFVQTHEEILQSPSELAAHEVQSIENYLELPEITKFSPPTFSVGTLPALLDGINRKGKVTYSPKNSVSKEKLYKKSCIVIAELSGLKEKIQKKEKILTGVRNEMNLLASFEVQNHDNVDDICCKFSECAWLCDKTASTISKISETGKLMVETEIKNLGYITSQDNDEIFYSCKENKLMTFSENLSRIVSKFEWIPYGLSVTKTKDILVCERMESRGRVVRYSSKGHKLKIIERCEGAQLFQSPERVTENQNGDVCVTDNCIPASLVVVNNLGKFQFRYTPEEHPTGSNRKWSLFRTKNKSSINGLASDRFGNILLSDMENKVIHVLDKWGNLLQFLSSEYINRPNAITVDNRERLWIVDEKKQIKIVAYLNCSS